jgi:hypothetical protein
MIVRGQIVLLTVKSPAPITFLYTRHTWLRTIDGDCGYECRVHELAYCKQTQVCAVRAIACGWIKFRRDERATTVRTKIGPNTHTCTRLQPSLHAATCILTIHQTQ